VSISYDQRADFCMNAAAKKLCRLMAQKKTNLCVAIDVKSAADLLRLAEAVGPHICLLKTHIDIIDDFSTSLIQALRLIADRHQFLIFEDRKFADIGHTTQLQYTGGIYHIADWADMVTAHSVPGSGILDGLKDAALTKGNGVLLIAEMSSAGALIDKSYSAATVEMAFNYSEVVTGFIAQHRVTEDPRFLHMTPGVAFDNTGDSLGQRYVPPHLAIERGSDVIIVGRAISGAPDPAAAAAAYREAAWSAVSVC